MKCGRYDPLEEKYEAIRKEWKEWDDRRKAQDEEMERNRESTQSSIACKICTTAELNGEQKKEKPGGAAVAAAAVLDITLGADWILF